MEPATPHIELPEPVSFRELPREAFSHRGYGQLRGRRSFPENAFIISFWVEAGTAVFRVIGKEGSDIALQKIQLTVQLYALAGDHIRPVRAQWAGGGLSTTGAW